MKLVSLLLLLTSLTAQAKITNISEVGVVITGGNTDTQIYNGKTLSTWAKDNNKVTFGGHYMLGTTSEELSARNWDLNAKYTRQINPKLGAFVGAIVEGDKFAGIDRRINLDLGASYSFFKDDTSSLFGEAGYRYRTEKNLLGATLNQSQARLYVEGTKAKNKDLFGKLWVEYLPNFTDSDDWQLNFEPSLNFNLMSNLALKLGYLGRYDNEPVSGKKKFDFLYTTSLIAQF